VDKKIPNDEFNDLHSTNVVRVIKSKRLKWWEGVCSTYGRGMV
jgi:hypothetical protein